MKLDKGGNMSKEILCIGELLIDFMCQNVGRGLSKGENFVKKAGGAPANVAAVASRLGSKSSFAGCVGLDPFGDFLIDSVKYHGIDTSMITREGKTTMAFVSIMEDGERDFVFLRGADENFIIEGFEDRIKECSILHLGSATALLGGKLKESYEKAMALGLSNNVLISFDPNYREDLWKGRLEEFIVLSRDYIKKAHFVKLSEEELQIIYKEKDMDKALDKMYLEYKSIVAITLGGKGTYLVTPNERKIIPSVKIVPVDTTGAGDAFVGAFLSNLNKEDSPIDSLRNLDLLEKITAEANKIAALVCTKMGAMSSLDIVNN